jgi:hypothetical protein
MQYLDHGLSTTKIMYEKFQMAKALITPKSLTKTIENSLNMTRLLIKTNNFYVKTAFAYFDYREDSSKENKKVLEELYNQLIATRENFMNAPGFGYRLFGVDQLIKNVHQALLDFKFAVNQLKKAPTTDRLELTIEEQQLIYKQILQKYTDQAEKFLHFEAAIDGRDILILKGDEYWIEHLRWDAPQVIDCRFLQKLPSEGFTVIPDNIKSRPMHPFVLQQPDKENNYTAKIYLYDKPGGFGRMKFDLYYIPKPPNELGLGNLWQD